MEEGCAFWSHRSPFFNRLGCWEEVEGCECHFCKYPVAGIGKARLQPPQLSADSEFCKRLEVFIAGDAFAVVGYAGKSASGVDKNGTTNINQDSLVMLEDPSTRSLVLGCLDGHGTHGHFVSDYIKKGIESRLVKHAMWKSDPNAAVSLVLQELESEVCLNPSIDTRFSGTTFVMVIFRRSELFVINIGDSRAIIGRLRDDINSLNRLIPIQLTTDHKPDSTGELTRIMNSGGRVFSLPQEGPASRVWLMHANLPGLAMSRSIGDDIAKLVGVCSDPDCKSSIVGYKDCVLVVATDGLWDVMSNKEVLQIACSARLAPAKCVSRLLGEAKRRWMDEEGRQDDITVCVATLLGRNRF